MPCREDCGGKMERDVGNNGGFRLLGNCWSKDGYASTLGDAKKFEGR